MPNNSQSDTIPDPDVLLALEPEELGAKMLFLLRERQVSGRHEYWSGYFHLTDSLLELWNAQPSYPLTKQLEINLAVSEACAWLEAQGLIIPAPDESRHSGSRFLSRRAKRFASESEFVQYAVARMLTKDALHPRITDKVWMAFMRGEFDVAVFQAMKAVEVSVREASGLGDDLVGVKLMRPAFAPEKGPLTDMTAEAGERVGRMELFAGAMASYKNPQSHRDVNLNDPAEAMEIILLANHLLRIVDARVKAKGNPHEQ